MQPHLRKHHSWPIALFAVLALLVLIYAVSAGGGDDSGTTAGSAAPPNIEVSDACNPGEEADPGFDPDEIIGLSYPDALEWGIDNGHPIRPVVIDGEPQAVTLDFVPDRVNVQVDDEVVTAYCGSY